MSGGLPVVVIAFDSLDLDLARHWAESGELPTFRDLFQRGAWSKVGNPPGFESGGAWMSFMTGVMPDVHGVYDAFYRFDPGSYEIRIATPSDTGCLPVWTRMSRAGRRVAIVDVPYSVVDPDLNGLHVCDWLVHVSADGSGPKCNVPGAVRDLQSRFGVNPLTGPNRCPINDQEVHTVKGLARLIGIEEQRIEWKTRFCTEKIAEGTWDFFMTVFHEAHDLGHMCWHAHDATHEKHNASVSDEVGDPLLRIYKRLDQATAELMAAAPPGSRLLVYSSHGIGPERTASRLLSSILQELEYGRPKRSAKGWLERAGSMYHSLVPAALRGSFGSAKIMNRLYKMREDERLRHKQCIAINPAYSTGGIHLNIAGREAHGVVQAGGEAQRLSDWLEEQMLKLVNAETGEPLVRRVTRTSTLYSGSACRLLPDLLVDWNMSAPIRKVGVPQIGRVLDNAPSVRSGDHYLSKQGFVISPNSGVSAGQRATVGVGDLSATLLALLGADTSDLSGRTVEWIAI